MGSLAKELLGALIVTIVVFGVLHLVVGSYAVNSQSMEPSLKSGERLVINKMTYSHSSPGRGDIIYYRSFEDNSCQVKRVIGLPGDVVEINHNNVYVNGWKLTEPYVKYQSGYELPPYQVPMDNYWVLGDNRKTNGDTPPGMTVPRENILGQAWIYSWPPDKWGAVNNYSLDTQMEIVEILP